MISHAADHDPILEHSRCLVCAAALRLALNALADLELGPKDAATLITRLRQIAAGIEVVR